MRIQTKLTLLLLTLCALIIAGLAVFATVSLDTYFRTLLTNELARQERQADFAIRTLPDRPAPPYTYLRQYSSSAHIRLTLIDSAGVVIFDSELPPEKLAGVENHLLRPEVQHALSRGSGTDERHSATLDIDMLYLATRVDTPFSAGTGFGGARIARIGVPMTQVEEVMDDIRSKITVAGAVVFAAVAGLTLFVSRRLSRPVREMAAIAGEIRGGNLERRIPIRSKDEFGLLAESLNSMVDKLDEDIAKLRKLERVRSEFLGNVSHELRTPIFAMQGMLETLAHGALDDKEVSRDFVERALANTRRLNALLGDLIEISRIESGEMKMSFRYFDLAEFLRGTVAELMPAARQKDIDLSLEGGTTEMLAYGDKERLKQVMVNLIDNAIKYTPAQGRVVVSCSKEEMKVRVTVRDTGVGISKEHQTRIFERFYRVDRERSREAGGTGLGLAIVKHIVEAHRSKIELDSEVGRGSSFSFALKS